VYVQPDKRLSKDAALDERALRPGMRAGVEQAALQAENLAESIDVPSRQRELAELQRRRPVSFLPFSLGRRRSLGVQGNPEWHKERSEQDGIGQRVGR